MKSLILMLLMASVAGAQAPSPSPSVADVARKSRARRSQTTATRVYTTDDIRTAPEGAEPSPADAAGEAQAPGTEELAVAADPVQQWTAETEKLRARIRELLDQDAETQLEINDISNRVYSPVTTVPARDQALAELGVAQQKLGDIRAQLEKARADLQEREAKGPPKS